MLRPPQVAQPYGARGDRPVAHDPRHVAQRVSEERDELILRHLARSKGELAMLNRAKAANIAIVRDVLRRIGEDEIGARSIHQTIEVFTASRIAT